MVTAMAELAPRVVVAVGSVGSGADVEIRSRGLRGASSPFRSHCHDDVRTAEVLSALAKRATPTILIDLDSSAAHGARGRPHKERTNAPAYYIVRRFRRAFRGIPQSDVSDVSAVFPRALEVVEAHVYQEREVLINGRINGTG